jgi:hypothetical protein
MNDNRPSSLEEAAAIAHDLFLTAPDCVEEIGVKTNRGPIHFTRYSAQRIVDGLTVRQLERHR